MPGIIRCAVVVPAFMIHMVPGDVFGLSGSPSDWLVAPGTAMVVCGPRAGAILAAQVVEHRSELGLDAGAVFFGGVQHRLLLVAHRFELHVLLDAIHVGDAGAFGRERRLTGLAGTVVADQPAGALLHRFVRQILVPFNDGCPFALVRGGGEQRRFDVGGRLREQKGGDRQQTNDNRNRPFHSDLTAEASIPCQFPVASSRLGTTSGGRPRAVVIPLPTAN